jgi:hypothetical protein
MFPSIFTQSPWSFAPISSPLSTAPFMLSPAFLRPTPEPAALSFADTPQVPTSCHPSAASEIRARRSALPFPHTSSLISIRLSLLFTHLNSLASVILTIDHRCQQQSVPASRSAIPLFRIDALYVLTIVLHSTASLSVTCCFPFRTNYFAYIR